MTPQPGKRTAGQATAAATDRPCNTSGRARTVRRSFPAHLRYPHSRVHLVTMDDGVTLAVREVGQPTASVTVVFCHGLCLDMSSWRHQATGLRRRWGDKVRMIFYDHRGHGTSGDGDLDSYTIDRLARDLATVLDVLVPESPVVLVGHSMGGMALLAYLGANRQAIGTRVIGVGLIATAADRVAEAGLGRALNTPVIDVLRLAASHAPDWLFHTGWHIARRLATPLVGGGARPARVRAGTMVSFLSAIRAYDESKTVALLGDMPALVLCGSDDPLTPIAHSVRLAQTLRAAELVTVAGAKHEVTAEHAETVCAAIARLLARAMGGCRPALLSAEA
jgi:pimeloyl-ACP methyl ester carboxylesterase